MISTYNFDICTHTKTWITDSQYLIDHVSIPGYNILYRNRTSRRGGGVGLYVKDHIKYKQRDEINNINNDIEHLWIEVQGKNKHSSVLIGVMYQPNVNDISRNQWLRNFDEILSKMLSPWPGQIIITGL